MDPETNPADIVHRPPPLNSDQLNYLIWRYLQEAGYAEAAVKLQRDWKVDLEGLTFAKYIKGQALISLVQKGLRYHHLSLTVDENGQQTKTLVPNMFFFGPESAGNDSQTSQKESLLKGTDSIRGVSPASTIANFSKAKSRDPASAAPEDSVPQPAKRGRKPAQSLSADRPGQTSRKVSGPVEPDGVNGHVQQSNDTVTPSPADNTAEDGVVTNGRHDDRMDIDEAVGANPDMIMEEQLEELPPLIPTLTNGESIAIQVAPAKVANLGPTSAVLATDSNQTITRAMWQPSDLATLIAQGDHFCGAWNLAGQELQPDSVKPLPNNLFPANENLLVTASAWSAGGSVLAVATYSEQGQVHLFEGQDFALIESLPASRRPITMLKWQPSSDQLVGVAPSEDVEPRTNGTAGSTLLVWELYPGTGIDLPLALALPSAVFDIDCPTSARDQEIFVACENTIYRCTTSGQVAIAQQWTSTSMVSRETWTFVRSIQIPSAGKLAIAAAADTASIWIPQHNMVKLNAHSAPISGLELRPRQSTSNGSYYVLEFATSSLDGYIKIWQTKDDRTALSCTHKLRFEPASQVMSLSFSPDGFCLAGASYNNARIWNAQHDYSHMASWEGKEPDWRGSSIRDDDLASAGGRSSVNGEGGSANADHTLAWHSDSKRLAFGLGSQIAIINFQR